MQVGLVSWYLRHHFSPCTLLLSSLSIATGFEPNSVSSTMVHLNPCLALGSGAHSPEGPPVSRSSSVFAVDAQEIKLHTHSLVGCTCLTLCLKGRWQMLSGCIALPILVCHACLPACLLTSRPHTTHDPLKPTESMGRGDAI